MVPFQPSKGDTKIIGSERQARIRRSRNFVLALRALPLGPSLRFVLNAGLSPSGNAHVSV